MSRQSRKSQHFKKVALDWRDPLGLIAAILCLKECQGTDDTNLG